ncbi:MAG: COX15/CtaA family protein [Leptospiraceae bacterium]|nr:COX15/CtaA family protein [Leptospiraceae bacterium]MBK7053554.1 COX15/CtaA family protein [Leptospiraceae bacterium]MBK9500320.1 COX15/CtaA family protein [Leptospiraceae bacterium]MBP9165654.1 COX15/CtaA family protein [Leptospiraceae bacterium]
MNETLRKSISVVYKLAFLLSVLIFINILFGPLVRATDSGLACPDWPLCHGKVIPPPEFRIWMEVGHRIYSGLLGFVVLALSIIVFKNSELRARFGLLAFTSLVVLVNQVILGKLTVTKLLDPGTVNMHLLNAVFLFTLIVSITAKANYILKTGREEIRLVNWLAIFNSKNLLISLTVFLVYFQLFMGGRVSSNYAGLACPDWPTCNGQWFPAMEGFVKIQMEHRFVAYLIVFLIIVNVAVSIFKSYDPRTRLFLKLALYAVGFQIILGVSNVLFQLPTLVTAAHTGMGVALFILVYTALYYRLLPEDNSL